MAVKKKVVFHYGCSFTENIRHFGLQHLFQDNFIYKNHARRSANNRYILDTFKRTAEIDSIAVIQWSSLTRPFDDNFSLLETSDNPLYDLLEEWYLVIEEAITHAEKNNIKLVQYIGWALWKDDELNDYHREKLKSYGIHWLESSAQLDESTSNCFQFQMPNEWSSDEISDGLYMWDNLEWGGMSEWIRENMKISDRYIGKFWNPHENKEQFDPHPSEKATIEFINKFLIPKLSKL